MRVHERGGERAEALAQYEAVIAEYAERKKSDETPSKAPDAVNQARFAAAVLHYENGQFDKARDLFAELVDPPSPGGRRRLYQGCCEVQLRQFAQAVETLSPLRDADNLEVRKRCCGWAAPTAAAPIRTTPTPAGRVCKTR